MLFLFFVVLLFVVCAKLFYIQIVAADKNDDAQYLHTSKILPSRGNVFDRNEEPLAINQTLYRVFAEPKYVKEKDMFIKSLDSILHIGEATLEGRLDMNKQWVSLATNIELSDKNKLEKFKLTGLGFENLNHRYYPESSLSAHLLGFMGKTDEGDDIGYSGLEGYYQRDLAGIPGVIKSERDLLGNPIFIGVQNRLNGENGRDLHLTIDKNVQMIVKKHLKEGFEKYQAKQGCVTVADPSTLEILAMSCLPDYDPNEYFKFQDDVFKNPVISSLYEPGSIFKPLVVAAALNEKVIKPNDTFHEDGPITIGEYKINTWDQKYEGEITMTRALEKSSNVGMVYIGSKLGDKKLVSYLKKFGFGETTDIDLQGEDTGYLKGDSSWYPIDYATVTFGQGIAVSQIQMLRAFAAIINGGNLMRPMIVSSITSQNGEINKIKPKIQRKVIDERASMLIRKMLESTVAHGEVKYSLPEGYTVGGKTGTAQIPIAGHYDPSKTFASFIGFSPVDKPRFVIMVSLKEPSSSIWGSETAEPIFFDIARDLFVYYNMPAK